MTTIQSAIESFLENIRKSQPHNTWQNYKSDLLGRTGLLASLAPHVRPSAYISTLTEEIGASFIQAMLDRGASLATRQRRAASMREFFRFAADAYGIPLSVDRLNYKIKSRHLLAVQKRIIEFPAEKIERILTFTKKIALQPGDLVMHRDLAFIWTLADTGLRVSEACHLKIGDIDRRWRATFLGKGGKQSTIHFGKHSRMYVTSYLRSRAQLDSSTGLPRSTLPLFSRHDQTSGKRMVKPISPKVCESIIHNLAHLALGAEYDPSITCHKFRHYFVTQVLEKTHGDLKAAKDLARHENIRTTEGYAHRNSEQNARISEEVFG